MTAEVQQLGDIGARRSERICHALSLWPNLSDPATPEAAIEAREEMDPLESDADRMMRPAMSRLFREQTDVRELIKPKTIHEQLESISNRREDVANLIEGIILENS